jgi:PAS domain S-box-containing protein
MHILIIGFFSGLSVAEGLIDVRIKAAMHHSSKALNILIVTADSADGDRLAALLREAGFDPRVRLAPVQASTLAQVLLDPGLDLVLAEFSAAEFSAAELPAGDGRGWIVEALALLKQRGLRTPIIVIADPAREAQAAALLEAGAADYLCWDRLARLGAAARRAVYPRGDDFPLEEGARYRLLFEHAHDIFLFVRLSDGRILEANRAAERAYGYTRAELLAMNIAGLRAPETRAQIQAQLEQVRALASEHQGLIFETLHQRKDGSIFPVEAHSLGVNIEGEKVSLSIIHDISQRKAAEQALERRMTELESLNEVARAAAEATSLDELIQQVVGIVRQRLYPDEFGVALLDESRGTLTYHPPAYSHLPQERRTLALGEGISGTVALSGRPMRVGDVRLCPQYIEASSPVRSELCVPLVMDGRVVGVLNADSHVLDYFNAADEQLLVAIAGGLSAAMEKIRMRETERKRLEELESLAEISREQMERLTALRSIDRSKIGRASCRERV